MEKRIKTKVYEMMIFEIIGAFLVLGMPFIGLPSMPWLAVAIMAFYPLYHFLPNESELLASRQRNVESLGGEATTYLVLKSMAKLFMFFFTITQFVLLPVSKLIPLAISWVYYFSLPVSYKTTQPFKMLEAWLRPFAVGPLIALFIYWGFLGSSQALSLALMAVAFFCTSIPRHRNAEASEGGQVRVGIINGNHAAARFLRGDEGMYQDQILNIVFLFLMIFALQYSQVALAAQMFVGLFSIAVIATFLLLANVSVNHVVLLQAIGILAILFLGGGLSNDMFQIIFLAVWELSLISGLIGGKETRPAMGILMIFMTLFVFSFTATGIVGTAVFGYWWPQIESTVEAAVAPIAPMIEQAQGGMSDAWLMLTNPMAYYDKLAKGTAATKSVVKEGGTTKSIELLKTDLFTSITGELEPRLDPLIGSFQIQNQGEFEANKIELELWASWQDPLAIKMSKSVPPVAPIGQIGKFNCSQPSTTSPPVFPTTNPASCIWGGITYPQEIRFVNFMFDKNEWWLVSSDNLNLCVYNSSAADCDTNPDATYNHSGQTVKINANLTYDYNVNVSIPVEVIEQNKYRDLLMARQITLQELTSQYSGGPVKATLWSQKQPIRNGEISLFVASIVNEGGGTLNQVISFKIYIPDDLVGSNDIDLIAQTFRSQPYDIDPEPKGCGDFSANPHPTTSETIQGKTYWVIECINVVPMKAGEYKRVSFFITPKSVIDKKTSLIVGLANYEYIKTGSTSIKVANAPWH
jgi:hypothetical protein